MKRYYLLVLPLILMFSRCAVNQDSAVVGNTNGYSTQMQTGLVENKDSRQPSGSPVQLQERYESTEEPVFYANSVLEIESYSESKTIDLIVLPSIKDEKDSTEVEPKLEPLVVAGTGLALAGVGAAVAGIFGMPILFAVAALLFGGSAFVTMIGWKKIKADPKKFKGEKFALANYIIIGVIGVLSSFYLVWLLFDV
ncbi:MAG: hypothetical protein KBF51_09295 [Chitinophagales bacterium]|nr:hypothetical protein [Chitinophagales bacterium]MBP9189723.1 hypothetical protein [Chitinophagales bacterium]